MLIAYGANLPSPAGPPQATLEAALASLGARGLRIVARSRWFRSPAFPAGSGPEFVNGAAVFETALHPEAALAVLHEVEHSLGRRRDMRWSPRTCDLDLVAWSDAVHPDRETVSAWMQLAPDVQLQAVPDRLLLPHPRLHERAFVLLPLCDVAPEWRHPILSRTVLELADALPSASRAEVTPL